MYLENRIIPLLSIKVGFAEIPFSMVFEQNLNLNTHEFACIPVIINQICVSRETIPTFCLIFFLKLNSLIRFQRYLSSIKYCEA